MRITPELKYKIATEIATERNRQVLLSHPDGYYSKMVMEAAERVCAMLEKERAEMTPEQAETCAWIMSKNFGMAAILCNLQMVAMRNGRTTLVMADGSYRVAKLGDIHEKPEP